MNIYLDIETIPTQRDDLKALVAEKVTPPASMSKPETIAKWEAEKKPEAIEEEWRRTALDGAMGEIVAIAWAVDDEVPQVAWRSLERPEADVLAEFFGSIAPRLNTPGRPIRPTWVGHFITGFDLRFIWQRAVILGVEPGFYLPYDAKPWGSDVFDTKTAWSGVSSYGKSASLDTLCKVMGFAGKGDIDGSKVWDYVKAGRMPEVAEYCKDDVEKARLLHRRMTFQTEPESQAVGF